MSINILIGIAGVTLVIGTFIGIIIGGLSFLDDRPPRILCVICGAALMLFLLCGAIYTQFDESAELSPPPKIETTVHKLSDPESGIFKEKGYFFSYVGDDGKVIYVTNVDEDEIRVHYGAPEPSTSEYGRVAVHKMTVTRQWGPLKETVNRDTYDIYLQTPPG